MQNGVLWCSFSIEAVEAHLLGVDLLVEVAVVEIGAEPGSYEPLLIDRSVMSRPASPKYPDCRSWYGRSVK